MTQNELLLTKVVNMFIATDAKDESIKKLTISTENEHTHNRINIELSFALSEKEMVAIFDQVSPLPPPRKTRTFRKGG